MKMRKLKFNKFCDKYCDRMYNPKLPEESQCTGYVQLKKMVTNNITPASLEEIHRWEINPTYEELSSVPDIKYLRFLHPNLRPFIVNNWEEIKLMEI